MTVYDVTNKKPSGGTGLGSGNGCDGPKGKLVVGKGLRVVVTFMEGGEMVVLGDPKGFPEGTHELMADIGAAMLFTPKPEEGFVSNRGPAPVKITTGTVDFNQNFFSSPAAAQVPQPDPFEDAFKKADPFEVEMKGALARIEEKLNKLLEPYGV